jgi:lipopolysaccharide export system permease protein
LKRIDKLILQELFGPWAFGVAIFTVLIMAGTYLFKITDYVVQGVPIGSVMELSGLLLPGIMAKTFPMAVLLATLLAFGRLSSDSEVVAMKAAGASLVRIMLPVGFFGFLVSLLAFSFNETLVPAASLRATTLQQEIVKKLSGSTAQATFFPSYENGRIVATVQALDFDFGARTLRNALVTVFNKQAQPTFYLHANKLVFTSDKEWRIMEGAQLTSFDGRKVADFTGDVWPTDVPKQTFTPEELLAANLRDLDSLSMRKIKEQIEKAKLNPKFDKGQIANLEFGYWNKVAVPLAALIFALVGGPLGIRNHRTSAASGFWMSVIIIFGYMMLANFMAIWARGGVLPAYVASFLPLVIGVVVAGILMRVKNT